MYFFSDQPVSNIANEGFMSRSSFASFHLTGIKTSSGKVMTSSVDRLFENGDDVFHSSNFGEFQGLPSIQETASVQSKSPEPPHGINKSMQDISQGQTGRDSPNTSTAKSSRRDSLSDRTDFIPPHQPQQIQQQQHQQQQQHHPQPVYPPSHITNQIPSNSTPPPSHQLPQQPLYHPQHIPPATAFNVNLTDTNVASSDTNRIRNNIPINKDASSNGGELFEKFQKQKLIRENNTATTAVNAKTSGNGTNGDM